MNTKMILAALMVSMSLAACAKKEEPAEAPMTEPAPVPEAAPMDEAPPAEEAMPPADGAAAETPPAE